MTLSAASFDYVRKLALTTSGLSLDPGKEYLIEHRLRPLALREEVASVDELISQVAAGRLPLRTQIVEALATNETSFFRDLHPFEALRTHIIPELLHGGPTARPTSRLSFWSAAASTGQEAYSLAMLISEHFADAPRPTMLATDFSRSALDRARQGLYSDLEINRGLPARLLLKYFHRVGVRWQVNDALRAMVTFRELNLMHSLPWLPQMDVIMLRNLISYLEPSAKVAVLRRVAATLKPGGYLILGGAETTFGLTDEFELVQFGRTICYKYPGGEDRMVGTTKWTR